MAQVGPIESLDVAMLTLADGRQVMVPLQVLAEVQQVPLAGREIGQLGEFGWRGYTLAISSLESLCGLPEPTPEKLNTVGIFKADKNAEVPFRAIAFAGTASPGRVEPSWLSSKQPPEEGDFIAAAILHEQEFLIPDLSRLLFGGK
ncbi:MAG: hypothetical protein ABJ308_18270 [Halieaceae bacterium]